MAGDLRRFARRDALTRQRMLLQQAGRKRAAAAAAAAAQRRANMARLLHVPRVASPFVAPAFLHPVGRLIATGFGLMPWPDLPGTPGLGDPFARSPEELDDPSAGDRPGSPFDSVLAAVGGFLSPTFSPFTSSSQHTGGVDTAGWTRTCFVSTGASNGAFSGFTGCVDGTVILNDGVNRRDQISSTTAGSVVTWAFLTGTISSNQAFLSPGAVRLNRIRENWRRTANVGDPMPNPITPTGTPAPVWPRIFAVHALGDGPRVQVPDVPPELPPLDPPRHFEPRWRRPRKPTPRRPPPRLTKELKWLTFGVLARLGFKAFHQLTEIVDGVDGLAMGLPGSNFHQVYNPFGEGPTPGSLADRYSKLSTLPEKLEFLYQYAHTLSPTRSLLGYLAATGQDALIGPLFQSRARFTGGPPIGMGYGL